MVPKNLQNSQKVLSLIVIFSLIFQTTSSFFFLPPTFASQDAFPQNHNSTASEVIDQNPGATLTFQTEIIPDQERLKNQRRLLRPTQKLNLLPLPRPQLKSVLLLLLLLHPFLLLTLFPLLSPLSQISPLAPPLIISPLSLISPIPPIPPPLLKLTSPFRKSPLPAQIIFLKLTVRRPGKSPFAK